VLTSWKELIEEALIGDTLIYCTLSEDELNVKFNDSFGGEEGAPFTAWSEEYVYFPICYDRSEWVGRAPRNPCDIRLNHQGGG